MDNNIKENSSSKPSVSIEVFSRSSLDYVNYINEKYLKLKSQSKKQNAFSFLKKVVITNSSDSDIFNAVLKISFGTEKIVSQDVLLSCLEKGKETEVDSFDIHVDPEYLYSFNEAGMTNMSFTLADEKGSLLASVNKDLRLLPLEQAGGEERIDEILASFVTPNDDEVIHVIQKAGKIREEKYSTSSFEGYQYRSPQKVLEQLDAIYLALSQEAIAYANPPVSFEKIFQKIRLPYETISSKRGTCLDLALLFCSCAEAIGLRPLLILTSDHALAGVYLEENTLLPNKNDSLSLLINNAAKGNMNICLVECTSFVAGQTVNFLESTQTAYTELEKSDFSFSLDISGLREEGILPLPTPHDVNGKSQIQYEPNISSSYSLSSFDTSKPGVIQEGKDKSKFDYWEEKLLDLNLSNRLINLKFTSVLLQNLVSDPKSLLSSLEENPKLNLIPLSLPSSQENSAKPLSFDSKLYEDKISSALEHHCLYVSSLSGEVEEGIKSLARKGAEALEESGANIVYLTLGLIRWYDNVKAAELNSGALYAPVFLIPVTVPRRKTDAFYQLGIDSDAIQLNTTVFEYFKQLYQLDIGLSDASIRNEEGQIDVIKVFNTIRMKIASFKNWSLDEKASVISTFSFAHFVMWNDIKTRKDELMKNKIVSSLVKGVQDFTSPSSLIEADKLDEELHPSDLALPLSADSSQVKAISDALCGESFILDGPPGTGKSQTIANMIVNCMYHHKTVLFVAEKKVALDVVKSRLDSLSLGSFCLQISSSKAEKSEVLSQLDKALSLGQIEDPPSYQEASISLEEERKHLNEVVEDLHSKKDYFISVYDAIIGYLEYKKYYGLAELKDSFVASLSQKDFEECVNSLSEAARLGTSLEGYFHNPLRAFKLTSYQMKVRDELEKLLPVYGEKNADLEKRGEKLLDNMGLAFLSLSKANFSLLLQILTLLQTKNDFVFKDISDSQVYQRREEISSGLKLYQSLRKGEEEIKADFAPSIFDFDCQSEYQKFISSASQNFLPRFFIRQGIYHRLKKYLIKDKKLSFSKTEEKLKTLNVICDSKAKIGKLSSFTYKYLAEYKTDTEADCLKSSSAFVSSLALISLVSSLSLTEETPFETVYKSLEAFFSDKKKLNSSENETLKKRYQAVSDAKKSLEENYSYDVDYLKDQDGYYQAVSDEVKDSLKKIGRLNEWVDFTLALGKVRDCKMTDILSSYEKGELKEEELVNAFKEAVYYKLSYLGLCKDTLNGLSSLNMDREIEKYGEMIKRFNALSVQKTAALISSSYPSRNVKYASSTDTFLLKKIIKSNGRGFALRSIFSSYLPLIQTLCPCFLMSPLSVAQFLDPAKCSFDIVIFDEASQIPTSEAIGAIARGKQVVIAGDQQQMPPTDFFKTDIDANVSGEEAIRYLDLESLLDDCIALGLPRKSLLWHYRSHHESLIAFSNNKFYKNGLYTFPSPSNQVSCVSYRFVGGSYIQKRGVNEEEGEAVVNEVLRRIKDPLLAKQSIGIVTFNSSQQELIDDLLDKQQDQNPELNWKPGNEEIFIKNLENVQGDERDVILFSICYGPEKTTHKMSMNFGPLSQEKGERRLNVAVSRAREEMVVFASCHPSDIRAERSKNEGASYLRDFLRFAISGVSSLSNATDSKIFVSQTSLADFLKADLEKRGYKADKDVGSSSFRVDLAVKDPNDESKYILGILTDGKSYISAPTCRDRNSVQLEILTRLKWHLVRVWSAEYMDHPKDVIERIVSAISTPLVIKEEKKEGPSQVVLTPKAEKPAYPHKQTYEEYDYKKRDWEKDNQSVLIQLIQFIVKSEGPIAKSVLEARIRYVYSFGRLGSKLLSEVERAEKLASLYQSVSSQEIFFWKDILSYTSYNAYRVGGEGRDMDEIPYEEILNAMKDILEVQGQMTEEDLIRSTNALFGYQALRDKTHSYLKALLDQEEKAGNKALAFTLKGKVKFVDLTEEGGE